MTAPADQSILIAQPGRQHADQLAAALVEAGHPVTLLHGDPVRPALAATLAAHEDRRVMGQLIAKGAARALPGALATRVAHVTYEAFDRRVARAIERRRPAAIIAYENSALASFRAAGRLGIVTILDAASVHHAMQAAAGIGDADTPFRARIDARKDEEIALADHILCCSSLAARSYIHAGVPTDRVHAVPLGFEPGAFGPGASPAPHDGPLRIVFVGRFTGVKGADLFADALDGLRARGIAYDCRIAAARADGEAALVARLDGLATLLGKVPHHDLADLYRWADILVMPSRFDSFGLVVPEALACGLPVLASNHVGASDFIMPGVNGDVVPYDDPAALAATLSRYAIDPQIVRAMRVSARSSAQGAEWSGYRIRVARTVAGMLS